MWSWYSNLNHHHATKNATGNANDDPKVQYNERNEQTKPSYATIIDLPNEILIMISELFQPNSIFYNLAFLAHAYTS